MLAGLGIPFTDAPRLVRGPDCCNRTTYEFDHALLGAQSGIGGGRYDGLSEDIGGPSLLGIGFAAGLDRIVLAIESERTHASARGATAAQVFGVPLGEDTHADMLTLVTALRRSGAAFAALIGADERRNGTVRIKDLKNGDQRDVAATQATDWLIERLATQ